MTSLNRGLAGLDTVSEHQLSEDASEKELQLGNMKKTVIN